MTFKFIESQSASGKEDGANFGSSSFGFTKDADISGTKPGDSLELVRSAPSDYSKQVLLERNRTYIDIEYLGSRGSSLNEDSITGAGNKNDEFEITGTGSNGIKLQDVNSPLKINEGVFKLTAKNVPQKTPKTIKIPKDFTILKSTASCSMCVLVEMIEVGIIIASEVPTDKCILVTISKSKTVNA